MAASLFRFRFRSGKQIGPALQQIRNAYTVLLPEVPEDTPATNPILQTDRLPQFQAVTIDQCVTGIGKLVIDYECQLINLVDELREPSFKRTFASVVQPIELLSAPLDHAWSVMKVLYLVKNTEEVSRAYRALHRRVQKARVQRFQNLTIYHALREVHADKHNLTESEQRTVDKYMLESRLNGIELSETQQVQFNNILNRIAVEKESYRKKLLQATERFKHTIIDANDVKKFPDALLRATAVNSTNPTRGPWEITLQPTVYSPFMQHCSNRDLRLNAWMAKLMLASGHADTELNNSVHIEEIRFQRQDQAALLGYPSFAHMSMETKMAGSVDNVMAMIATLHKWSRPAMEEELAELQEFAASKGFEATLEPWDVPYWRHKQKNHLFNLDIEKLREYFPLPHVVNGLFNLCNQLFGVVIKDCSKDVQVWHETVKFYQVYDEDGSNLGSFYLDPYSRPGEKLPSPVRMECGINRSAIAKTKPLAYLIMNVTTPPQGQPAYLTYQEVVVLFKKFGHCLQHLLTTVPQGDVSGLNNIEWDAVDLCPNVMSHLMHEKMTLAAISAHRDTGQPIEAADIENLINARHYMVGYDMTYQLYLSALDLQLHSTKEFWADVLRHVWAKYMPIPMQKKDSYPCAWPAVFCDEYPAAYFSSQWAEMIAADAHGAFVKAGGENKETREQVGRRFRKTFLALGGGCHPSEIFRRFRGRDPSPDALLRSCGLRD